MRGTFRRRCAALTTLVLAAVAGQVVAAPPAAAVPGLVFVSATTAFDSSADKAQLVACPPGKRVYDGGAFVGSGGRQVAISGMQPFTWGASSWFYATAAEDGTGYAGSWLLVAYAICGPDLPGLEYVTASSPTNSDPAKHVVARCPAGKRVLGAGGAVTPNWGEVLLDEILPDPGLAEVRVQGIEDETGFALTWTVSAFAVCVPPLAGMTRVSVVHPPDSLDKDFAAVCPAGTRVHGLAGDIIGAGGQILMTALMPGQELSHARFTVREDETGFDGVGGWYAHITLICAA